MKRFIIAKDDEYHPKPCFNSVNTVVDFDEEFELFIWGSDLDYFQIYDKVTDKVYSKASIANNLISIDILGISFTNRNEHCKTVKLKIASITSIT